MSKWQVFLRQRVGTCVGGMQVTDRDKTHRTTCSLARSLIDQHCRAFQVTSSPTAVAADQLHSSHRCLVVDEGTERPSSYRLIRLVDRFLHVVKWTRSQAPAGFVTSSSREDAGD